MQDEKEKEVINEEITETSIKDTDENTQEEIETQRDESVEMAAKIAQKEEELKAEKEKVLRLHADFDNYRKRMQKEKEEWLRYASMGLLEKLLPILDNFERAISSLDQENDEIKGVLSGVEMIHRQLMDALKQEGLEPVEAVGKIFDPLLHEAMMQTPAEEGQEDNQVVEDLRRGYKFKDKVIRPTMVRVAKKN